jgi:hypothetical protein
MYVEKNPKNYQQTNQVLNIIFAEYFLQSYNHLKLVNIATNVKIMLRTKTFNSVAAL